MQSVREINVACFAAVGLCGGGKKEKLVQCVVRRSIVRYLLRGAVPSFFDSPHMGGVVR